MRKLIACIALLATLLLASCSVEEAIIQPPPYEAEATPAPAVPAEPVGSIDYRQWLLESGWWTEEMLDSLGGGVTYENLYNQARFAGYTDMIANFMPVGPSGMAIAEEFFAGMLFDDRGMLTVMVTHAGFNDPDTQLAIQDLEYKDIIVNRANFTVAELLAVSDALWDNWGRASEMGLSSTGHGAENAVTLWLDPYSHGHIEALQDFLLEIGVDPQMVRFEPAVTQEMVDWRANAIAAAMASPSDQIVLYGDVTVSQTGIIFTLINNSDWEFSYGSPFDLAYYAQGQWRPVPWLPGAGGIVWTAEGMSLPSGSIDTSHQAWDRWFGELPPGRYAFIREGSLVEFAGGNWYTYQENVAVVFEFYVTEE